MTLLAAGSALILLAGVLARALERRAGLADTLFRWGVAGGSLLGLAAALRVLISGASAPEAFGFGLDPLSAWFVIVVLGPGACAAVYGVPYLEASRAGHRVGTAHLFLSLLLLAVLGVVTAQATLTFLVAFEVMAVAAYLLVVFEHQEAEVRRAGLLYIALAHVSIIALIGMFAAWMGAGPGGSFAQLAARATDPDLPVALILLLALAGFGTKAGMVPGHFWLPAAHAAAPSHVSAVLSGAVVKSGIYGLLRVLALLGPPPAWWGWSVLLIGLASAVLGVVWALAQHDIKRLLAYHSVENIGIILMGLGLGALGSAYGSPVLALFGFTGAVLHTLNHALFKSLLFLGAGVVARAAGTREIDRLGGLIRSLPRTGWAFFLGSMAIVGLPPLNGFISEWIIFRGLLEAGAATGAVRAASVTAAGLALTGALALACFTKLHGVVFLGTPREDRPAQPGAERGFVGPQAVLAAACVAIGLLPFLVVPAAAGAASIVLRATPPARVLAGIAEGSGALAIGFLGLLLLTALIWGLRRSRDRAGSAVRETWACAYSGVTSRMQYTASSYAAGLLSAFGPVSGSQVVAAPPALEVHAVDPVLDRVGLPLWSRVRDAATRVRRLQMGRLLWYLLYVIAVLVALLIYLWLAV